MKPSIASRWALASLSLPMLLSSLGTSIANIALPTLADAFSASFQGVQWVVLAYLLAITAMIVSVGRLGDIVGRRRLLLVGIAIFIAASLFCGIAPSLWTLIAARSAQGLGAAVMMALSIALAGETVSTGKTGTAMGLLGTMSAIGTALGPTAGGILIASLGWRAIFLINVPLGLVAMFVVWRHLPSDRPADTPAQATFDGIGTALLALSLGAFALAMTASRGSFRMINVVLLLIAGCGMMLFVRTEMRTTSPLVRIAMFRDPTLSAGLAMSTIVSTVMMTTLVVGPFYLVGALGLEPAQVGIVMSIGPVATALTGVPAGRLVDRIGAPRMTTIGLAAIGTGSLLLSMVPFAPGVWGYIAPIAVVTIGYGLFQTANNTAVMVDIASDQRGVVGGMLNLSRNLGLITGASGMGAVFALASSSASARSTHAGSVAAGMRATFAVAAALIAFALTIATGASSHAIRRALAARV